jgi:hypothetical protein
MAKRIKHYGDRGEIRLVNADDVELAKLYLEDGMAWNEVVKLMRAIYPAVFQACDVVHAAKYQIDHPNALVEYVE